MSHAYNEIGEYGRAKGLAGKALTIKPDYRQVYLTLASIYRNLGKPEESLIALEKAKGLSKQRNFFVEKAITDTKELKYIIENKIDFRPIDTVYLKNGRQLKGVIREETEDSIILEMNIGSSVGTVTLSRDSIERIVNKKKQ
jgi:tetratricopeptide (TPR) repeat protein